MQKVAEEIAYTVRMLVRKLLPCAAALLGLALLPRVFLRAAPPPPAQLLHLPLEGELAYEVRDARSGDLIPAKLTLLGVDGTPEPQLTRSDIGRQEGDAILAYNRIMSATGLGAVRVPLGSYDIYVSRGPEWDLFVARRVRITDKGAVLRAALRQAIDTTGWLSGDFHVHAACSTDSRVPMIDRVYEFLADAVELIVSTDHNVVCDYGPLIAELGVGRYITSATGDEITTAGWGHFGAFPLPQDLMRAGHGAVLVHGRTARDFFADVRKAAPGALINVHHPRIDPEIGYFNLGKLDSDRDRAGRAGFSFDFDAVEVLNGYQDAERRSVDRMIHDWFSLLNHGHLITATGNSDTHHLTYNLGGYPRNYVYVNDDRPAHVTLRKVVDAVKGRHVIFTTGPFVRLVVNGGQVGDLVRAPQGVLRGEIEVQAAPWVSVNLVMLYVNGHEEQRIDVPRSTERVRLKKSFTLTVKQDVYVVARVDGDQPLAPVVGDRQRFDVRPLALTNPVFLDVDGNGAYDPPARHGSH